MKKSLFLTSAIMTAVLAVGLSTSTYAWYQTTVSEAVESSLTVNAKQNETGTYEITVSGATKIYNTADNTATKMLPAAFGKAKAPAAEAAKTASHWFTAIDVKQGETTTTTLDATTTGILCQAFTYTLPADTTEVIADTYYVGIDVAVTGAKAGYYKFATASELVNGTTHVAAAGTDTYKVAISKTAAQTVTVYVWLDGTLVSDTNVVKDDDTKITFSAQAKAGQQATTENAVDTTANVTAAAVK